MKIILILSLVLVWQLLQPLGANVVRLDSEFLLWAGVSLLALSSLGGQPREEIFTPRLPRHRLPRTR